MATPFIAGCSVAAAAVAARSMIRAWHVFKTRPARPRAFYHGGFQSSMTKREAALILGVRERTPANDVKDAYKKVMKANHPDRGGSHYLSNKINEAKIIMLGGQNSSSAF